MYEYFMTGSALDLGSVVRILSEISLIYFKTKSLSVMEGHKELRHLLKVGLAAVNTRVYPKVSGLAAWSENCKWFSSLLLGAAVSLFCESVF
jgi:hypothetical protein